MSEGIGHDDCELVLKCNTSMTPVKYLETDVAPLSFKVKKYVISYTVCGRSSHKGGPKIYWNMPRTGGFFTP